jgi:hypothetical protein
MLRRGVDMDSITFGDTITSGGVIHSTEVEDGIITIKAVVYVTN